MSTKKPTSKKHQQERDKKQRQWQREDESIRNFRAKAPYIKAILRGRGCTLPFYDYLDSYADEFQRIADAARVEHPSLLGVHEVDDPIFAENEKNWSKLGYGDLQQIFFGFDKEVPDYGTGPLNANMCGSMTAFLDNDGTLRSVILIQQSVKGSAQHRELKYALKIASLLHEIGHVQDLEQGLNFDVPARRFRVIEAEVIAHLFALEQLAKRNLAKSFEMLANGLRDAIPKGGYISEVAERVLERLPSFQLVDWQTFMTVPPTPEEVKKLGPKGIEAMKS
jgi:hypothetical protein